MVRQELEHIRLADGIHESAVTGGEEDYSQYKPRGYYEGDTALEQYFRAMMWYGRIHFRQEDEETDRSALLITKALSDDAKSCALWESVYSVTSFFAGASDDLGVCEYAPLIREAYGSGVTAGELAGNPEGFERFHAMTASLSAPKINSVPIADGEDNVILGFRFMGQRFTIDAAVMQQLIYSNVKENSAGDMRMLPDVLDVPAALGSGAACRILEENGAFAYAGYAENMERLQEALSAENDGLWSASLYACWLDTLRPLLAPKGEGYPMFMQNGEWSKKNLECFAGSFTELKHDTILYSKQVIAEMGGYGEEELDDRGYVEPEPLVYAKFANLADQRPWELVEGINASPCDFQFSVDSDYGIKDGGAPGCGFQYLAVWVRGDIHHNGGGKFLAGYHAVRGFPFSRFIPEMFDAASVTFDKFVFLSGQGFVLQFLIGNRMKPVGKEGKAGQVFFIRTA